MLITFVCLSVSRHFFMFVFVLLQRVCPSQLFVCQCWFVYILFVMYFVLFVSNFVKRSAFFLSFLFCLLFLCIYKSHFKFSLFYYFSFAVSFLMCKLKWTQQIYIIQIQVHGHHLLTHHCHRLLSNGKKIQQNECQKKKKTKNKQKKLTST